MPRNENQTCRDLIEPALQNAGWMWEPGVVIGPGRVNLAGESMYDETQQIIADYVLRYAQMPLSILEAKAEGESAADGMQQGSRYANRLGLRYSIATNGTDFILTDIKPIQVEAKVAELFAISEGDVFVSRSNTQALVGLSAIATQLGPQGTIYPDLLIKLTADRLRILPEYLAFALRFPSVRNQIRSHAKGTSQSMVKISGATLRELLIPVPDTISEQEQILSVLRNRHNKAKAIQSCVGEIPVNHLRNAILRKAFAGEL